MWCNYRRIIIIFLRNICKYGISCRNNYLNPQISSSSQNTIKSKYNVMSRDNNDPEHKIAEKQPKLIDAITVWNINLET